MSDVSLEVSCTELKSRLDAGESITLVDCREPHEHEIVRISGARLLPMATIPSHAEELGTLAEPIVVYCHHGMRSAQTAAWLRANGIPTAQSLAGGVDAWAVEIDPTLPRY